MPDRERSTSVDKTQVSGYAKFHAHFRSDNILAKHVVITSNNQLLQVLSVITSINSLVSKNFVCLESCSIWQLVRHAYSNLLKRAYFLPFSSIIAQSSTSPGCNFRPFTMSSGIVARNDGVFRFALLTVDLLGISITRIHYLIRLLRILSTLIYSSKNLLMPKSSLFWQNEHTNLK